MTCRFGRLAPAFWRDARCLPGRARLVLAYALTCEHRQLAGLFRLPVSYIADDLGFTVRAAREALADLTAAGEVIYDADAELMYLVDWRRHDSLDNASAASSAALRVRDALRAAPKSPATHAAAAALADEGSRLLDAADPCDPGRPKLESTLAEIAHLLDTVSPTVSPTVPTPSDREGKGRVGLVSAAAPRSNNGGDGSPVGSPSDRTGGVKESRKQAPLAEATRLATLLADLIRGRDPKAKVDITGWVRDLEALHRLDDRDWGEIERVIQWCQADEFWRGNILSAGKLRKQFTALVARSQAVRPAKVLPDLEEELRRA